jgi:hypothetical protein
MRKVAVGTGVSVSTGVKVGVTVKVGSGVAVWDGVTVMVGVEVNGSCVGVQVAGRLRTVGGAVGWLVKPEESKGGNGLIGLPGFTKIMTTERTTPRITAITRSVRIFQVDSLIFALFITPAPHNSKWEGSRTIASICNFCSMSTTLVAVRPPRSVYCRML